MQNGNNFVSFDLMHVEEDQTRVHVVESLALISSRSGGHKARGSAPQSPLVL